MTEEDMDRVVSFVRASCERDLLPEWLTEAVVERFRMEFLQDPRYIPRRLAERTIQAMQPPIYDDPFALDEKLIGKTIIL